MAARRRTRWWLVMAVSALGVGLAGCSSSDPSPPSGSNGSSTSSTPNADLEAGDTFVDGRFTSKDGGFRVEVPSAPERVVQTETVDGTELEIVIYNVAVSDDEAYQISFVDYPERLGDLDPTAVLDGAVEGAAAQVDGTIEDRQPTTVDDQPAVDAEIAAAFPIFVRITLIGRRLHTLQQVGPAERTDTYARLLSSFQTT